MKKFVSLALLSTLLTFTGYGQDTTVTVTRNKYIQFSAGLGVMHTNLSSLNASMKSMGYPSLRENNTTFSVAPAFFFNRFLFRGEFMSSIAVRTKQANNIETIFGVGATSINIGYNVIQKPRLRLYPYIGIAGYLASLQLIDRTPAPNMEDVVNTPHHNSTLTFANATMDIGIGMERLILVENGQFDCPQTNVYTTFGFRVGYNWAPGSVKARYNDKIIADGPEFSFRGPYLKVFMAMDKKMRNLKWKR